MQEEYSKEDFYRDLAATGKFEPSEMWDPAALEDFFRFELEQVINYEWNSQRLAVHRSEQADDVLSSLEALWQKAWVAAAYENETLWENAERSYGRLLSYLRLALAEARDIRDVAGEVVKHIQGGRRKPDYFLDHNGKLITDLGCLHLWRLLKLVDVPYVNYYGAGLAYYLNLSNWDLPKGTVYPSRQMYSEAPDRFHQRVVQAKRYLKEYYKNDLTGC